MIRITKLTKNSLRILKTIKINCLIKKNYLFKVLIACVLISSLQCYTQTIQGSLSNKNGEPLRGKLLIKSGSSPNVVSEFSLINNGFFSYKLKKTYTDSILLEVSASGYVSFQKSINFKNFNKIPKFDIILSKEEVHKLNEVFIQSSKKAFRVKKDTITYNVEAYKDGTERKVEDLLKKLPGVEINEKSGLITYNGTSVETVLLEGDNLFGYNYTLGTKNINLDIVSEVEAIENYTENKLLNGIENTNKVALNLKLKDKNTDYSGNVDIGIGIGEIISRAPTNSSVNLLGISKKYKSFLTLSYNNVGQNMSPFNYFSFSKNLEQIKELSLAADKIIPEVTSFDILGEKRANINNQFFSNHSALYKISEKLTAKVNLYYIDDKIENFQNFNIDYQINNQIFSTFDNYQTTKRPNKYRGDLKLGYKIDESSILEYETSFRDENIKTNKKIFSNQSVDFNSDLKTNNTFLKQKLVYTKKLSNDKVWLMSAHFNSNKISQGFNLSPSLISTSANSYDTQQTKFEKNYFKLNSTIFGRIGENKYNFSLGTESSNEPIITRLLNKDVGEEPTINNENNLDYNQIVHYGTGSYNWNIKKLQISPKFLFRYIKLRLIDRIDFIDLENNKFVIEPTLSLFYKTGSTSSISGDITYSKNINPGRYQFTNEVLINNRNVITNLPNINLQNNQSYRLYFINNNLFNQSRIELSVRYSKQKGTFFLNSEITPNRTINNHFFLPEGNETIDLHFGVSKLVKFLKTNFKYTSHYSINNYKNIINNSDLRNNRSTYMLNSLFIKTSFENNLSLENEITHIVNKTISDSKFSNSSLQNKFKFVYTFSSRFYTSITNDFFIPDLMDKSRNLSLLDVDVFYKLKNDKWEFSLQGKNLTNEKEYVQIQNDDNSTSIFTTGLLPRLFLLNIYYRF